MTSGADIIAQANALAAAGRAAEAVALAQAAAARGDPFGLFTLADWRLRGAVLPQDPAAARLLFGRAGERGLRTAAFFHTNLLAAGVGGPADWPAATARLAAEAQTDPRRAETLALIEAMALAPDGTPARVPQSERLSASPDVRLFPGLFTAAECDYLVRIAEPGFARSVVHDSSGREYPDPVRTSDGSTLHWLIADPAVHALNLRLAAASGTAVEQGEPLQILRYAVGQQYRPHLDALPGVPNPRVATALVYLNQGYEGGATRFVRSGLEVRGRKGDGLVFRNTTPDRRPDKAAEHEGMPVTKGVKLIASRWICAEAYDPRD